MSKNISGKYSQKLIDHAKQSATEHLKLLQKEQFRIAETTGDLLGTKILMVLQGSQELYHRIVQRHLK